VDLVTVLRTSDLATTKVVKSLLEAEGIPCLLQGEGLQDLWGLGRAGTGFNVAAGPVQVQVRPQDAAVALELQGRLSKVHVPATYDVSTLQPWGSHPYLDPLWSTTATEVGWNRYSRFRMLMSEPLRNTKPVASSERSSGTSRFRA
jgi:hypothetical protein